MERRPLVYPILHEAAVFTALFICVHMVEEMIVGLLKGESLAASVPVIGGGGVLRLICVAEIIFFALIPYFAFKNVSRALGAKQVRSFLFGDPRAA